MKKLSVLLLLLTYSTLTYSISISTIRDLNIGSGTKGEQKRSISESSINAAIFLIKGWPRQKIKIVLPASVVICANGCILENEKIHVSNFTTTSTELRLNSSGRAYISIGGTRHALPIDQAEGNYTSTIKVSVKTNTSSVFTFANVYAYVKP